MAAPINQNLLNTLIKQRDTLASSNSGMDYTGKEASRSDVSRDVKVRGLTDTIEKMKSQGQSNKWYGDSKSTDVGEGSKQPLDPFSKFINTVNTPLYGVVGGIKGALGMNKGKGILESAYENADWGKGAGRQTAGDLMREAGVNNWIAAPAGFMADVALDPVNWVTAGIGALVPRVGAGLVKGTMKGGIGAGLKAAKLGATSRLGKVGLTALDYTKYIPGLRGGLKNELTGAVKGGLKLSGSDWAKKLSSDVVSEYAKYNKLIGRDALAEMGKGIAGSRYTAGGMLKGAIEDYIPGGKDIIRVLEYSPEKFADMSDYYRSIPGLKNAVDKSMSMADEVAGEAHLVDFLVDNKDKVISSGLGGPLKNASPKPFAKGIQDRLMGYIKEADDIAGSSNVAILDMEQRGKSMLDVTHETLTGIAGDLRDAQKTREGLTGVHWYDKLSSKTSNFVKDKLKFGDQVRSDLKGDVLKALEESKLSGALSADELLKVDADIANIKKWKAEAEELTKFKSSPVSTRTEADIAKFTEMTSGKTPIEKILKFENDFRAGKMTTGEKVIKSMDFFSDLFKFSMVATSPTAMMNAVIGNPAMMMAAGIEMKPELLRSVYDAFNLSRGKGSPDLVWKLFLSNEDFLASFAANDSKLQMATGQSMSGLMKNFVLDNSLAQAKKAGLLTAVNDSEITEAYFAMKDDLKELARKYALGDLARSESALGRDVSKRMVGTVETSALSDIADKAWKRGEALTQFDSPTGMIPNEIANSDGYLRMVKDYFKEQAAKGSVLHKTINFGVNGMSGIFEGIDQTYKLGLAMHLTNNGMTEAELRIASKTYPKIMEGISQMGDKLGGARYKVSWNKAIDFSNEVFMNYAAMPPAVKLLRTIPIVGSPFVSFSYAMLPKFAKAVVHNPSFFNKVDFFTKEFSGQKGPLEREALKSKYSSMFNSPGMIKLPDNPFFKQYPMYLNIMNYNPFMSLSILGDTQRRYSDDAIGQTAGMLDQLGIMQNPVGQMIKDLIILPAIMGEEYENQNRFGQKVYPDESTALEKAGHVTKNLIGSYIPKPLNLLAAPGLAMMGVKPDVLPDSLGGLVGAIKGQNKKGVIKKDDAPIGLAAREVLKQGGIQIYPHDVSYARQSAKNKK